METVIEQEKELKQEALTVTQKAALVKITDQTSYDSAAALLLEQVIPFRKRWTEYWSPLKKAAYDSWQAINAKFNEGDKPMEAAERQIKGAIREWDEQKERERAELQRKAQEEAERREQEQRLNAAVVAEQAGATEEEIEQIVSTPAPVVAAPVAPTYERASGISKPRANWKCVITDLKKLCAAIGKGQVPTNYVTPNETALNARARADEATMQIPGCIAKNFPVIAGRIK
jgi:hypothetical protein